MIGKRKIYKLLGLQVNILGRLDFVQFVPGFIHQEEVSPGRTRQPVKMRLFQVHARRMLKDVAEHIMKAKVLNRAFSMERTKIAMNCGKTDSLDNCCGITECKICSVNEVIKRLDESLVNLCSLNRGYDTVKKGIDELQKCCLVGKKEPIILVTCDEWTRSVSKILIETMRVTLEVYGTTGVLDAQEIQLVMANLDFVYESLDKEKLQNSKFYFEVFNEDSDNEQLELIQVQDFFNDEEQNYHLLSLSMNFKVAFGVKQIPKAAFGWDGKIKTAEKITAGRNNRDVFFVRVPNGEDISRQVKCPSLFSLDTGRYYGSQGMNIVVNNTNPHLQLLPCAIAVGPRLILE